MIVSQSKWDRGKFKEFILSKKNYSPRVAGNIASRCAHIERALSVDLILETSCVDNYKKLLIKISEYVEKKGTSPYQVRFMGGMYRTAVRNFAEFSIGKGIHDYPFGYLFGKHYIRKKQKKDI
jgi:hypothetical protein